MGGMNIKEIRGVGELLGRAGLAERALEIAKEIVADGSYKRAIKGAGQLKVIAGACGFDEYWSGKVAAGESVEEWSLEEHKHDAAK